ncbi:MAG: head GIN domain-containing protein [Leeuwenhoekiella sp.]
MSTFVKILASVILSLLLTSCNFDLNQVNGNGNVVDKDLDIDGEFNAISVSNGWEVFVKKGAQPEVTASIDENLYEFLDVHLDGNTLEIEMKDNSNVGRATSRKIFVTYTEELDELKANSAGEINLEGVLKGEKINFDVSSAGSIMADLEVRHVHAEASSAAVLRLKGLSQTFEGSASSAAMVDAEQLKTETASADVSSAGSIKVFASKAIDAEASSGGQVSYWGNPKEVRDSESSGGAVNKKS